MAPTTRPSAGGLVAMALFLGGLSFAEMALFRRLLFDPRHPDYDFVLLNVRLVLEGTPVSLSWQQRLLGPLAVTALGWLTHDLLDALALFFALALVAANALLCAIVWRRTRSFWRCALWVIGFGLARLLLLYRLEYPWDQIDVLLFLAFGAWAAQTGDIFRTWPVLLLGLFNHETVLYIPFYYLLPRAGAGADGTPRRRELVGAASIVVLLALAIQGLRNSLYRGRPNLPGQVFEPALTGVGNHFHLVHNLRQVLFEDFHAGRSRIAAGVLAAMAVLVAMLLRNAHRRAALFSLGVMASIFCFGYVNETRHYLPLLAFWFAYAWPGRDAAARRASAAD